MSVSHHVLLRVCVQVQTALSLTSLIHFDYKQGSLFCSASQHAHTFRSASLLYPLGILWPFRNCLFSVKHRRKPFRLPGDPALMTAYVQWFLCSLLFWYFSVGLSFRPDMSGSYRSPDKRCLSKEYAHSFLCQKKDKKFVWMYAKTGWAKRAPAAKELISIVLTLQRRSSFCCGNLHWNRI